MVVAVNQFIPRKDGSPAHSKTAKEIISSAFITNSS